MPKQLQPVPPWQNSQLAPRLEQENLWLFAYGSLIWRPDFEPLLCQTARLNGYSRRLCIASYRYRGTPQRPGLVFGLMPDGGYVDGFALKIPLENRAEILDQLWDRELMNAVYNPQMVNLQSPGFQSWQALTFVVNTQSDQYRGRMGIDDMCHIVSEASGECGSNVDYVVNTAASLAAHKIEDCELTQLADKLSGGVTRPRLRAWQ